MRASSDPDLKPPFSCASLLVAAAGAVLCALPGAAHAADDDFDRFTASAAVGLTSEDNVFRQTDAAGTASDNYRSIEAGLRFNVPVSKQQLVGEAAGRDVRFGRFDELDHQAWRLATAWLWEVGSRIEGRAGYSAESVLASLANLASGTQSATPNQLRIQRFDAEAAMDVGSRWRLRGMAERIRHHNSSPLFRTSDMTRHGVEAHLTYLASSGSRFGFFGTYAEADLPNPQTIVLLRIDNSHRQHRLGGLIEWVPTAKSRFVIRGGQVARDYLQFPQRDYMSWMGSVTYDWRPTERVSVVAVAQRDLSDFEQVNLGYVLTRGLAVRPTFHVGPRTRVSMNLETAVRSYRGDLALGTLANPGSFRERIHTLGVDMDFTLTQALGVRLFGRHEARDASSAAPQYQALVAGAELRATF
jgi:hypothetical protein